MSARRTRTRKRGRRGCASATRRGRTSTRTRRWRSRAPAQPRRRPGPPAGRGARRAAHPARGGRRPRRRTPSRPSCARRRRPPPSAARALPRGRGRSGGHRPRRRTRWQRPARHGRRPGPRHPAAPPPRGPPRAGPPPPVPVAPAPPALSPGTAAQFPSLFDLDQAAHVVAGGRDLRGPALSRRRRGSPCRRGRWRRPIRRTGGLTSPQLRPDRLRRRPAAPLHRRAAAELRNLLPSLRRRGAAMVGFLEHAGPPLHRHLGKAGAKVRPARDPTRANAVLAAAIGMATPGLDGRLATPLAESCCYHAGHLAAPHPQRRAPARHAGGRGGGRRGRDRRIRRRLAAPAALRAVPPGRPARAAWAWTPRPAPRPGTRRRASSSASARSTPLGFARAAARPAPVPPPVRPDAAVRRAGDGLRAQPGARRRCRAAARGRRGRAAAALGRTAWMGRRPPAPQPSRRTPSAAPHELPSDKDPGHDLLEPRLRRRSPYILRLPGGAGAPRSGWRSAR